MAYDVVVVGAGVGGLTVAALLAKRGMNVCLLERQSQVGGCIARVEFGGLDFDPGMGLYPGWGAGEIYEQLFSELSTAIPRASLIESDYVVRFENHDVRLKRDDAEFFGELRRAFPESPEAAVDFYERVIDVNRQLSAPTDKPRFPKSLRRLWSAKDPLRDTARPTTTFFPTSASARFRRFVDAQLRAFLHSNIERCSFASASKSLSLPRRNLYSIEGGIPTLAEGLADSIKSSGGTIRLNQPVLRFAYNDRGEPTGVDLLSGETVEGETAIISNLTIWDTFGKLIGLDRTPPTIKSALAKTEGTGAFIIYAAVENSARLRLPASSFLVETTESKDDFDVLSSELAVSLSASRPDGGCAASIKTTTAVSPWFSFQSSEEDYEARDQSALESAWSKLHGAVPEFGAGIEVIETANPRTYYEKTRRKLGMVMGADSGLEDDELTLPFPNVYLVGDTSAGATIEAVVRNATHVANKLTGSPSPAPRKEH